MRYFIPGFLMTFGSLWVGSYFLHGSVGQWWNFPAFMTAFAVGIAGTVLMAFSVEVVRGP